MSTLDIVRTVVLVHLLRWHRHIKTPDENPTIGIVLCKRKKDALVELTLPKDANIFSAQYQLYLPSKEELQRQIQEAAQEAEF